MQDQQSCQFWFKITPTQVISVKPKPNTQKSFLIKLGSKEGKCKSVGSPIEMNVEVVYSKSFQKFYPSKGIIKVYDVSQDGTEMFLTVGAFDTQGLLSGEFKETKIEKDLGPCKVSLTIETKNLTFQERQQKIKPKVIQAPKKQQKSSYMNIQKINNPPQELYNIEKRFIKSPRVSESDCQQSPTPYIMDDSSDFMEENSKSRCSQGQKQAIGQELVEQRRKNKVLEDKLEKSNIKIQLLRKNIAQKNNQMKAYYQNFKAFSAGLESDSRGQYIFEMNEKKREVSLRFKANCKFKEAFQEFIAFMIRKMTQNNSFAGSEKTIEDEAEVNRILSKIQNFDLEKKKSSQESYKLNNQISNLRKELGQKSIELATKETMLRKKMQQIVSLQQKVAQLTDQKTGLEGLNQYLQQRDAEMQTIIESLKKMITDKNQQMDQFEQSHKNLKGVLENLRLQIDEMKEQNANLLQTIESYRQNYGELKTAKDKALQRQFKQCIRWIDQQNHDEDLILEDTTEECSDTPTVTSIIKSFGEIENMPLQEICSIRKEVINVLKRLDEFVARNSLN